MEIPVLIEQIAGNGFRAKLELAAEGATRDEALARLRELLRRSPNGAELSVVETPGTQAQHPWMEFAGMHDPDDPVVQNWEKAMAEYRRKIDEHPELP
jgi:hypothetical protein